MADDGAWREQVRKEGPVLGRIAAAVTPKARVAPEPAHVRSWGQGVPGEQRVGEVLDSIEGIVALHDRKVSGTQANIDHLGVTPAGVWVIDAKRYPDSRIEVRDVGGWFSRDERLYVGGRDRTKLVDGMSWQVGVVSGVMQGVSPEVPVGPRLCFVESTWGWSPTPARMRGVAVCWSPALPEILSRPGHLDTDSIERLARCLYAALPQA